MSLRTAAEELPALLDTAHRVHTVVDSWRGGTLLAASIPLLDGELTEAADQEVPERVTLQVPVHDPATGARYHPGGDPLGPLNKNGQRLRIAYVAYRSDAQALATQLGWFQIVNWEADSQVVQVEAAGLLNVVKEYRLLAPTSPPAASTFTSEVRRLLEGTLPVVFHDDLVDRPVPSSFAWEDDRLAALYDLADAWPALLTVDEAGVVTFAPMPTLADPAEVTWTESRHTVVDLSDSGSRDDVPNVLVARGEATDAARSPVTAVARHADPASPYSADGPYGQVVERYASPLLGTTAAALAAGETILARKLLQARAVPLTTLPDPRVRPWVRGDLVRDDGTTMPGVVTACTLPLTAEGGAAKVEVGEL